MESTNPKIESLENDTATEAFFKAIIYIRNYLIFLCLSIISIGILGMINVESIKDLDNKSIDMIKFLIEKSYDIIIWIFIMLVGSYIFKGKGGSKFFESIGNLIEKITSMYKAKAGAKFGMTDNKEKKD